MKNFRELINLHMEASDLHVENANFEKSSFELEEALEVYQENVSSLSPVLLRQILLGLANNNLECEHFEKAIEYAKRYLEEANKHQDVVAQQMANVTLGRIYLGEKLSLNLSLEHFKLSNDLLEECRPHLGAERYNKLLAGVQINLSNSLFGIQLIIFDHNFAIC